MSDHPPTENTLDSEGDRSERVQQLVLSHLQRRFEGQHVSDAELIAQYPDLMPELAEELRLHHEIAENRAAPNVQVTASFSSEESQAATSRIGNYKLLHQIGEGGMGTVWMADQEKPVRRRVALKLIKKGLVNQQVIARFEAERQALAMMDHPNIAKVLDAGATDDGSPYFVMELVQGISITEYCDQNKLTPAERLTLFIPVCQAVQHAHQKGIVHRDLKPSNVLVSFANGTPTPKVIDFGLAKALQHQIRLTEKTMFTEFGRVVGTVQYMSPEQAAMDALDVDARTDVYSLGVMLYELLIGSTPLDRDTVAELAFLNVLKVIREDDPPRPSTRLSESGEAITKISERRRIAPGRLQQILHGELDWIVMKALEKDRTRRYATASELAQDIHRYLNDEAVEARPPTVTYTAAKFIKKHRSLVAMVGLLFALILISAGGMSWFAFKAARAERGRRQLADEKSGEAIATMLKTRRQLYIANMRLTQQEWDMGNLEAVEDILETHAEDESFHDFEWKYWSRVAKQAERTIHSESVRCFALSSDGTRVLTGGQDGVIRMLDIVTGNQIREFADHRSAVSVVTISPNGSLVASVSGGELSGEIIIWKLDTGEIVWRKDYAPNCALFSSDGKKLALGFGDLGPQGQIAIVDSSDGRRIWSSSTDGGRVEAMAFSSDGKRLASAHYLGPSRIWDADDGSHLLTLETSVEAMTLDFSPDDKKLVVAGFNKDIIEFDSNDGRELKSFRGHQGQVTSVVYSSDGQRIASCGHDRTIRVWDVKSGGQLFMLNGHRGRIVGVRYLPSGKQLVSGGSDKTVRVWSATSQPGESRLLTNRSLKSLAVVDDGSRVVAGGAGGTVELCEIHDSETAKTLTPIFTGSGSARFDAFVAADSRKKRIAAAVYFGSIYLWDQESGKLLAERKLKVKPNDCEFNSAKDQLAVATDNVVTFWSDDLNKTRQLTMDFDVADLAFDSTGKRMIYGGAGGQVAICDLESGEVQLKVRGHLSTVTSVCFGWEDRVATASGDGRLVITNTRNGERLHDIECHSAVHALAFTPTGHRLAIGVIGNGMRESYIRMLETTDWQTVLVLPSPGKINDLEFDSTGELLYAAGDSGLIVWDTRK